MSLIDREKLIEKICGYCVLDSIDGGVLCESCSCGFLIKAVKEVPTVDVETVKHGHWKKWDGMIPVGYEGKHYCSLCGGHAPFDRGFHERLTEWCCGCGAKMDLKDGEQDA